MIQPFVSVVIATRNRAALLEETLAALLRQTWPRDRFEIVVADNRSTDRTHAVVDAAASSATSPAVQYLYVHEPGKSYAVNAAFARARGDIFALTDDDVLADPGWIAALARAFEDERVDFVAGRIRPRWEDTPPSWMSPALYGVLAVPDNGDRRRLIAAGGDEGVIPIGANMAVRRAVVDRIGGLRTDLGKLEGTLRTGEDHEFFLRMLHAGCAGVYEPTALVAHLVPRARLERPYFRRWLHQNGQDVARLERAYTPAQKRWFGVPRYLWRQALVDSAGVVRATIARDERTRFATSLRILWFGGYVREAWCGDRHAPLGSPRLAVGR